MQEVTNSLANMKISSYWNKGTLCIPKQPGNLNITFWWLFSSATTKKTIKLHSSCKGSINILAKESNLEHAQRWDGETTKGMQVSNNKY